MRRESFVPSSAFKLCSDHFLPTDYLVRPGTSTRKLKPDAAPSVFSFPSHLQVSRSARISCWYSSTLPEAINLKVFSLQPKVSTRWIVKRTIEDPVSSTSFQPASDLCPATSADHTYSTTIDK